MIIKKHTEKRLHLHIMEITNKVIATLVVAKWVFVSGMVRQKMESVVAHVIFFVAYSICSLLIINVSDR